MSKKNTNKVTATAVAVPKLNKRNAEGFADFIFSEQRGVISCVKLCQDTLQNSDRVHCAIGEAYATFVNPSLKSVLSKDDLVNEYVSKYIPNTSDGSTGAAIDALVDVANVKDKTPEGKKQLAKALFTCVSVNDTRPKATSYPSPTNFAPPITDLSAEALAKTVKYLDRASKVAEAWRTNVVPLLK